MVNPKNPPEWFRKKVYDINLRLINECAMSWAEVLEFWEECIAEAKAKIDEENE